MHAPQQDSGSESGSERQTSKASVGLFVFVVVYRMLVSHEIFKMDEAPPPCKEGSPRRVQFN